MSNVMLIELQFAVGLVFGWSALAKLRNPNDFVEGLVDYGFEGRLGRVATTAGVIGIELSIAVSHLMGLLFVYLAVAAIVFCVALAEFVRRLLMRDAGFSCMCFGFSEPISAGTIARLMLLITSEAILLIGFGSDGARSVLSSLTLENLALEGVGVLAIVLGGYLATTLLDTALRDNKVGRAREHHVGKASGGTS